MDQTKYIWVNGKLIRWKKARTHILTHALHYGGGVFEGARVYETPRGPAVFRLKEHTDRLFYSAKALSMEIPYSKEEINQAIVYTVKKNKLKEGYIRPIAYFGYGKMGLNPAGAPVDVAIACWPWGKYLSDKPIDVKISKYIRIHPKSGITDAKISGHYVNSIMAVNELAGTKFHEALFLDFKGNIAEGPGENFFIVKKGVVYTPTLGTILKGITRDSIFKIADYLGIRTKEKVLKPKDALSADEAFFSGTAAEVTAIGSINKKKINKGKMGPVTAKIQEAFMDVVHGRNKVFEKYLTFVV